MNRQPAPAPQNFSPENMNDLIIDSIQDIKGKNILKLDLRKLDDSPTDYFIICEGESSTQISAIADRIRRRLKEELAVKPSHVEGKSMSQWVLVDYFSTVVHIFHPEARAFYELEELWNDADITEYQDL